MSSFANARAALDSGLPGDDFLDLDPYKSYKSPPALPGSHPLFIFEEDEIRLDSSLTEPTATKSLFFLNHWAIAHLVPFMVYPDRLGRTNPQYIVWLLDQAEVVFDTMFRYHDRLPRSRVLHLVLGRLRRIVESVAPTDSRQTPPDSIDGVPRGVIWEKAFAPYKEGIITSGFLPIAFRLPKVIFSPGQDSKPFNYRPCDMAFFKLIPSTSPVQLLMPFLIQRTGLAKLVSEGRQELVAAFEASHQFIRQALIVVQQDPDSSFLAARFCNTVRTLVRCLEDVGVIETSAGPLEDLTVRLFAGVFKDLPEGFRLLQPDEGPAPEHGRPFATPDIVRAELEATRQKVEEERLAALRAKELKDSQAQQRRDEAAKAAEIRRQRTIPSLSEIQREPSVVPQTEEEERDTTPPPVSKGKGKGKGKGKSPSPPEQNESSDEDEPSSKRQKTASPKKVKPFVVSMTSVRDKRPTRTVNYNETSKPKREKKKKVAPAPSAVEPIVVDTPSPKNEDVIEKKKSKKRKRRAPEEPAAASKDPTSFIPRRPVLVVNAPDLLYALPYARRLRARYGGSLDDYGCTNCIDADRFCKSRGVMKTCQPCKDAGSQCCSKNLTVSEHITRLGHLNRYARLSNFALNTAVQNVLNDRITLEGLHATINEANMRLMESSYNLGQLVHQHLEVFGPVNLPEAHGVDDTELQEVYANILSQESTEAILAYADNEYVVAGAQRRAGYTIYEPNLAHAISEEIDDYRAREVRLNETPVPSGLSPVGEPVAGPSRFEGAMDVDEPAGVEAGGLVEDEVVEGGAGEEAADAETGEEAAGASGEAGGDAADS
ncbi:hypothetical protein B0H15DRAFT_957085 [Mycena belliarum]|uniref:Uncharacterized protein n=1 Tax=Mycena belliarum TaxID=1033014 RepID=A0AAD6TT08_9AGAR|nr:hypothetical protein B0H15DRAFT_957085 [Mycena belliae]